MKCGNCGNKDSHKLEHVGQSTVSTLFAGPKDNHGIMTIWFMCLKCGVVNCAKPNWFGIPKFFAFRSVSDFLGEYSMAQRDEYPEFEMFIEFVDKVRDSMRSSEDAENISHASSHRDHLDEISDHVRNLVGTEGFDESEHDINSTHPMFMFFGSSTSKTRREVEKVIEDLYVRPFVEEIQNCKQFKSGELRTSEEFRQFFIQRYDGLGDSELGKFAKEYLRKNQVLTLAGLLKGIVYIETVFKDLQESSVPHFRNVIRRCAASIEAGSNADTSETEHERTVREWKEKRQKRRQ